VTGSLTPEGGKAFEGKVLNAVAELQEIHAISVELFRERLRRDPLAERT
jgi:hypothetical protein